MTSSGEAGVGKSRLLYELDGWAELLPEQLYYFKVWGPSWLNVAFDGTLSGTPSSVCDVGTHKVMVQVYFPKPYI